MNQVVNDGLTGLNQVGRVFCDYAGGIFVQSAVLVSVLLIMDWLVRKRVRAVFRYCVWMLVLVKLVLPPTLALPTGIGYWLGDRLPAAFPVRDRAVHATGLEPANRYPSASSALSRETPQVQPPTKASRTDVPIAPAASGMTPIIWQGILFLLWLVGVLVFAALLVQRLRFVKGLIAFSSPTDMRFQHIMEECGRKVGIHRAIELRASNTMSSPAICGLLKPIVLVPARVLETLSPDGLKAILIHELAHMKRGDLWVNTLQTVLQVIHFYNPFVWLANAMIRRTREEAVDETVLVALGGRARDYSNTLIDIGEMALWRADLGLRLIGVAESEKTLRWRIKHMLTRPIPKSAKLGVMSTVVLVVMAAMFLPMACAERSSKTSLVAAEVTGVGTSEKGSPVGADDVVDPNTGLKYVVSKKIAGTNDVIEQGNRITLSPNGKFLLWWGHVVPLDGSPAFMLKELKDAWIVSWSPDGQKIAFISQGIAVLPVSPDTGRPTGPVRRLLEQTEGWVRGKIYGKIYWSADSERILFVKRNSRMEIEVGTISLRDGRLNRQPDYADFGLVSPDGKMVAYSMPDGVWVRPVNGGTPRIARSRAGMFEDMVAWTSDSQWVASAVDGHWQQEIHFARLSDGQQIDVFPPDDAGAFVGKSTDGKKLYFYRSSFDLRTTSKVLPVSGGPALDAGPSLKLDDLEAHVWSSDSASLAVLGDDKEGNQQLWSIPLKGGERVRFNMDSLGKEECWVWSLSPDGTKLLYLAWPSANQGIRGQTDLYVIPISLKDGRATGPAALVFRGWRRLQIEQAVIWSPDGTRIAVPHKGDQGYELWVLSTDGGKPIRITQIPDELGSHPQWSPDGKMIAFSAIGSDRQMIQVIPAEGGTATTILTTPKGQSPPFGWSSDCKEVVVVCDGTITGFPIAGGSARVVVRLQDAGYEDPWWLGWSPDGQCLAFYGGKRGEASRLCLFSPSTGKIAELENSPQTAYYFSWSPDSKMICCTAEEDNKVRSAGVLRELDVAEAVQKAEPIAERKPAVANPQAEPIPGPVFTDNFDNGPSKHWQFQDLPAEGPPPGHAVENGQLVLANARACLYGIDWTDYIVTVRVCMKEAVASGEGNFGIEARATPSQFGSSRRDRYSFAIFCNDNVPRYLWLGINYADALDVLRHGTLSRSPCSLVRDKWYTLEFEIRGQHLRGYLDGKLMVEATDARLSKGGPLWIGTWRSSALFDDFSVRQLP